MFSTIRHKSTKNKTVDMWITLWITIITELEDRSYTHHKKEIVIMKIEHKFKYRFM